MLGLLEIPGEHGITAAPKRRSRGLLTSLQRPELFAITSHLCPPCFLMGQPEKTVYDTFQGARCPALCFISNIKQQIRFCQWRRRGCTAHYLVDFGLCRKPCRHNVIFWSAPLSPLCLRVRKILQYGLQMRVSISARDACAQQFAILDSPYHSNALEQQRRCEQQLSTDTV